MARLDPLLIANLNLAQRHAYGKAPGELTSRGDGDHTGEAWESVHWKRKSFSTLRFMKLSSVPRLRLTGD
jgi:hypothetical protein